MIDARESKKQESTYPLYALPEALGFAEAVKDSGGANTDVQKSILASHMKIDEKSVNLSQRLGTAKCYKMTQGWGSYSLTDTARQFFFPTTESDKAAALLSFLGAPAAFWEIIKRFDGSKLPSNDLLGNILHKEARVPISWKNRVAQIFVRSAEFVGVIDERGFLRYKAAQHRLGIGGDVESKPATIAQEAPKPVAQTNQPSVSVLHEVSEAMPNSHTYILPLPNGRKVLVQAPLDITASEIGRLKKWMEFTLQVDWSGETKAET